MPFSPISLLFVSASILAFFIAAKILTQSYKLSIKESIYFVIASLVTAIAVSVNRELIAIGALSTRLIEDATLLMLLFVYFGKIKSYSAKKSCILVFLLMFAVLIFEALWESSASALTFVFVTTYVSSSPTGLLMASVHVLGFYIIFVPAFLLLVKMSGKLRATVNSNNQLQLVLAYIAIFCIILMQVAVSSWRLQGYAIYFFNWNTLFLLGFTATVLVSFYYFTRSLKAKLALQQKEAEQENFKYYMQEIEQQQTAMRKFKHDYQNILLSLEGFLEEKDLPGLKDYYSTRIKTASDVIVKSDFALENLSKIKVMEIKSILVAKLMMAQSLGINVTFEADEDVDYIPIDSVILVRMLGIVLDNAIEALSELCRGELLVGCLKTGADITFIIQNTCCPDTPGLRKLKQAGFSTKGKGRGLGLSNLSELAASCPNVMLKTSVKDGNFIQMIVIGGLHATGDNLRG